MRVKGLFNRLIRKLLNRRQASSRYPASLKVRTTSATGDDLEVMSEDVSERGIRLRFEDYGIADILGHREEITMEIFLEAEVPPRKRAGQVDVGFRTLGRRGRERMGVSGVERPVAQTIQNFY